MDLMIFPGTESGALPQVSVDLDWNGRRLILEFTLRGDLDRIAGLSSLSGPTEGEKRDELWKTTCFECFLRPPEGRSYFEINLSPGGDWAYYQFDSYRQGMAPVGRWPAPLCSIEAGDREWKFRAEIDLSKDERLAGRNLSSSPCVVLESQPGGVTYWSRVHRQAKPDFHHPDHFVHLLKLED